jgi:hypothetical protein
VQRGRERAWLAREVAAKRDNDHHQRPGVEYRQPAEHGEAGAVPEEVHQREAGERDRHHARENGRADPDESLDQAEFLLLQLDREQLEPVLHTRQ